jgi:uncharacterized protein YecA (UPF0149 family)
MNSVFERMEEEITLLKAQKEDLSMRLLGMSQQMGYNRVTSKKLLDERDAEIASLKNELLSTRKSLSISDKKNNSLTDEIQHLKKELQDNNAFTENVITYTTNSENSMFMKNIELQGKLDMISEMSSNQIKDAEEKLAKANGELFRATHIINSIREVNTYITQLISHG